VPAALLMAIGMQESGCNKGAVGSRGEQGIMQVAGNACDNQSGDCQEPWYNIHKGASILVEKMGGDPNGNIIEALGMYNGWMVSRLRT
jgi:membrane-bound lytic murein transglycosylase MltF